MDTIEAVSLYQVIQERTRLGHEVFALQKDLGDLIKKFYEVSNRETYIRGIYENANVQFSRLRKTKGLIPADFQEIEKWIGRAKSDEGLINILNAIKELKKYKPSDIRQNLYGLTQRIIIGGANHEKGTTP
jgi:hypothetical protein